MALMSNSTNVKSLLPECRSRNENGGCELLNVTVCKGSSCSFAGSGEDEEAALIRWRNRLVSLSDAEQTKISKKYYGGSMPWKNL